MLANMLEADRLRLAVPLRNEAGVRLLTADGPFSSSRSMEVTATGAGPTAEYLIVGLYLLAQAERAAGPPTGGTFEHCALSSFHVVLSIRGKVENSFISTGTGVLIDGKTETNAWYAADAGVDRGPRLVSEP
jgi:hypothetical protein